MYYIGIDNGLSGAISVIDDDMEIIDVMKYPRDDIKKVAAMISSYVAFAALEKPIRGGKHIGAALTSHEVFGGHKMALECLRIDYVLANPAINQKDCWRKEFNFKGKKTEELKPESIEMVNLLFDGRADKYLRQQKKNIKNRIEYTKPDDNIAESLLLAEYARRTYNAQS